MGRSVFEAYVDQVLAPSLGIGQVVVMDYLSAHKVGRARELIEGRGCDLLYLPALLAGHEPHRRDFSKVKSTLRKAQARTRGGPVEAMGLALRAVSASDARGFFEHSGYRATVQPFRTTLYLGPGAIVILSRCLREHLRQLRPAGHL